jgi:hypothetical protein
MAASSVSAIGDEAGRQPSFDGVDGDFVTGVNPKHLEKVA